MRAILRPWSPAISRLRIPTIPAKVNLHHKMTVNEIVQVVEAKWDSVEAGTAPRHVLTADDS
jgi:hypothetical protein